MDIWFFILFYIFLLNNVFRFSVSGPLLYFWDHNTFSNTLFDFLLFSFFCSKKLEKIQKRYQIKKILSFYSGFRYWQELYAEYAYVCCNICFIITSPCFFLLFIFYNLNCSTKLSFCKTTPNTRYSSRNTFGMACLFYTLLIVFVALTTPDFY